MSSPFGSTLVIQQGAGHHSLRNGAFFSCKRVERVDGAVDDARLTQPKGAARSLVGNPGFRFLPPLLEGGYYAPSESERIQITVINILFFFLKSNKQN